jgi:hypothetical protein
MLAAVAAPTRAGATPTTNHLTTAVGRSHRWVSRLLSGKLRRNAVSRRTGRRATTAQAVRSSRMLGMRTPHPTCLQRLTTGGTGRRGHRRSTSSIALRAWRLETTWLKKCLLVGALATVLSIPCSVQWMPPSCPPNGDLPWSRQLARHTGPNGSPRRPTGRTRCPGATLTTRDTWRPRPKTSCWPGKGMAGEEHHH